MLGALWHGYALLEKYPPDWTAFGLARTSICALTAALLFVGLKPSGEMVRTGSLLQVEQVVFRRAFPAVMIILLSAVPLVLTIPDYFSGIVREGQILSIGTALVLAAALLFLMFAARRAWAEGKGDVFRTNGSIIIAVMTLMVALILVDEMSRENHWLGLGMSDRFGSDVQIAVNWPDLQSYRVELAWYSAAVLLFVLLPYCWPRRTWTWASGLSFYIPPRAFAIVGLPACGLVFETWNVIPYQIWFFLSLLIAADLAASPSLPRLAYRIGAAAMAVMLLSAQIIFLYHGPAMADGYALSEIREFVMSVLVLVYASWLFAKAGHQPSRPQQIRWE